MIKRNAHVPKNTKKSFISLNSKKLYKLNKITFSFTRAGLAKITKKVQQKQLQQPQRVP